MGFTKKPAAPARATVTRSSKRSSLERTKTVIVGVWLAKSPIKDR